MTKRKRSESLKGSGAVEGPDRRAYPEVLGPLPIAIVRCTWMTRVVIPAQRTVSGKRYEFEPGETKTIHVLDKSLLLSFERKQSPGCCEGVPNPPTLKYFEEA